MITYTLPELNNMGDDNKQKILDSLNYFRKTARSINSIAVGVRDLQSYAKQIYGLKQQEVTIALDYLVEHGWVDKITEERAIYRGKAVIPTFSSKYKLSQQGVTMYDSDSRFNTSNRYSGINITNMNGVVVLGNNNVVNNKYRDIYVNLDFLEQKFKLSDALTETQKLDAFADIQSIKDQLAKDIPNFSAIKSILKGLTISADIAGTSELLNKITESIQNFLI